MRPSFTPQAIPETLTLVETIRRVNQLLKQCALSIPSLDWEDVRDYGANTNGAISTSAIQSAIYAQERLWRLFPRNVPGGVGSVSASIPALVFPSGLYRLGGEVTIGQFSRIEFDQAFFLQLDPTAAHFVTRTGQSTFMVDWSGGMHCIGGLGQIRLSNSLNIDSGMVLIDGFSSSACDPATPAVDLTLRSCHTAITRPRILTSPYFLKAHNCDMLEITGTDTSWINGYGEDSSAVSDQAVMRFSGDAGTANIVNITNMLMVPEADGSTSAESRWVDLHDTVQFNSVNTRWGGENGGMPIIYNYQSCIGSGSGAAFGGISFSGGSVYAGQSTRADRGMVVLKTAVPLAITVAPGITGLPDSVVVNDTQMSPAIATWLLSVADANHPRIALDIAVPMAGGSVALSSNALAPYLIETDHSTPGGPAKQTVPSLVASQAMTIPVNGSPAVGALALAGQVFVDGTDLCYYDSAGGRKKITGTAF